jgi:hypothetical protein
MFHDLLAFFDEHVPQVKAHYNDPLYVVTLCCFSRWSFFNLNHVKTTKDFHNVFAYYGKA